MTLRPDDRVLFLAIPSHTELAQTAASLKAGTLVALGPNDEVDAARAAFSQLDNVMFVDAKPHAIPWREAYFTKILVPPHFEPLLRSSAAELHRVLAPGGEIIVLRQDC